jgi:hypothetical protein
VGICAEIGASPVNKGDLLKSREDMKKDIIGHFETFLGESYPEILPQWGKMGKHRINNGAFGQGSEVVETHSHTEVVTKGPEGIKGHDPDVKDTKQPSLDEILEWLGDPDKE